jgi:hypothetical protein
MVNSFAEPHVVNGVRQAANIVPHGPTKQVLGDLAFCAKTPMAAAPLTRWRAAGNDVAKDGPASFGKLSGNYLRAD